MLQQKRYINYIVLRIAAVLAMIQHSYLSFFFSHSFSMLRYSFHSTTNIYFAAIGHISILFLIANARYSNEHALKIYRCDAVRLSYYCAKKPIHHFLLQQKKGHGIFSTCSKSCVFVSVLFQTRSFICNFMSWIDHTTMIRYPILVVQQYEHEERTAFFNQLSPKFTKCLSNSNKISSNWCIQMENDVVNFWPCRNNSSWYM